MEIFSTIVSKITLTKILYWTLLFEWIQLTYSLFQLLYLRRIYKIIVGMEIETFKDDFMKKKNQVYAEVKIVDVLCGMTAICFLIVSKLGL